MSQQKYSVIVPVFQPPNLSALLENLSHQTLADAITEVIIVGQLDVSNLPTINFLRFIEVLDRPTAARNRNIGARNAHTKWLCFLDADCIPAADWIEQFDRLLEKDIGLVMLYGSVEASVDASYWSRCDHVMAFSGITSENDFRFGPAIPASLNFCIRKDIFEAMRGFDESFQHAAGEDLDFFRRFQAAHHPSIFVDSAIIEHRHNRNNRISAFQHLYRYGQATVTFRRLRGYNWIWQIASIVTFWSYLAELGAMARIVYRLLRRILTNKHYLTTHLVMLLGIAYLEWAHTKGMIDELRRSHG